jgi:hypothetical protein
MKYFVSLLITFFLIGSISYSGEFNILLEQYTSAKNGVCPDGIVYMDNILAANPGRVIGINFHINDGMQFEDGVFFYNSLETDPKARILPSATVSRAQPYDQNHKKKFLWEKSYWDKLANQFLSSPSAFEVFLDWKFNPITQKIFGAISCSTTKDLNCKFAFQVIICENNVSGTGDGFDQVNEYNDYEGHPFYKLGNPVKGYVHNRVARGFIGGLAGNLGDFPDSVKAGVTYKWEFEADIPSVPSGAPIKPEDVFLVGLVGESHTSFVYPAWNCIEASELKPVIAIDNKDIAFGNTTVDITNEKAIKISNSGAEDLSIEGINISGEDESAFKFDEISFPQVVKPGGSFEVKLRFLPKAVKEYSAPLKILSNDKYKPVISVNLTGTGTSSSVETPSGAICNISISPNPVTNYSQITYTITATVNTIIRINDTQGRVVEEICNGLLNSGTYNYTLNTGNLPSGKYFITAQFDSKWETVPFVVTK